jgi:hypothetical protein
LELKRVGQNSPRQAHNMHMLETQQNTCENESYHKHKLPWKQIE